MNLLIRTEIDRKTGTGHFMRCAALAQYWEDKQGSIVFLCPQVDMQMKQRFSSNSFTYELSSKDPGTLEDAQYAVELAQKNNCEWVMLDGYGFNEEYEKHIKKSGLSVLFVDDFNQNSQYCADILLNQNCYASEIGYKNQEKNGQILLGTDYVILRDEFLEFRGWERRIKSKAENILITLGGSDQYNITSTIIDALTLMKEDKLNVKIVLGALNVHEKELKDRAVGANFSIDFIRDVSNMPALMQWADCAVCAGGTTCYELAFMGLPACAIILADNQILNVEGLSKRGIVLSLGKYQDLNPKDILMLIGDLIHSEELRRRMSRNGRTLVDGFGRKRILDAIKSRQARSEVKV